MSSRKWEQRRRAALDEQETTVLAELVDKAKKRQAAMDDEREGKITRQERQARMRLIGIESDTRITRAHDRLKAEIHDVDEEVRAHRQTAQEAVAAAVEAGNKALENPFRVEDVPERMAARERRRLRFAKEQPN